MSGRAFNMETRIDEDFKLLNTNIEKSLLLMNDLEHTNNSFNSKLKNLLAFFQKRKLRKIMFRSLTTKRKL